MLAAASASRVKRRYKIRTSFSSPRPIVACIGSQSDQSLKGICGRAHATVGVGAMGATTAAPLMSSTGAGAAATAGTVPSAGAAVQSLEI